MSARGFPPPDQLSSFHRMTPAQREVARRAIGQSSAATRVRTTAQRDRRRNGFRVPRKNPLREEDLYEEGIVPSPQDALDPDLTCTICLNAKAHSVIYACQHSHCYACIRIWLERQWTCPLCKKPMRRAPRPNVAEQQTITGLFPDWAASTRVSYSWDGLTFPRPRLRVVIPSSDDSS
ncbi:hypothetical protein B0H15DRAFT_956852 [Mycena belliarum]|uniref:RING-type domain-containing protein n=1 Tax=Mycena belliarum TaxID=1033014 RepID=A0AAD6XH88_9AGAR|nr:hypothetical protein B0H15DRAFT_956852 [Mycena belliae]